MSEATKESAPVQQPGEVTANATGEEPIPLSAEEADRVASLFKPTWEVDSDEDEPPIQVAKSEAKSDASPEPIPPPEPPPEESQDETQPARAEVTPADAPAADSAEPPVVEDQGPIDIVADIPKRTEFQLKDEPSVVVPHDEAESARRAPPPVVPAFVEPDIKPPVDARGRNKKIVIAVVAVAGLVFLIGGAKALLSGDDDETGRAPAASTEAIEAPAPEAVPAVTAQPAVTPEATEQPPEAPPPAETAATAEPAPKKEPPPAETVAAPATTPKPPKTAATEPAPPPTQTSEPKPPKTAATPASPPPTKPSSGGIVRETPF